MSNCECGHWIGEHRRILDTSQKCKLSAFYRCEVDGCTCKDEPRVVWYD